MERLTKKIAEAMAAKAFAVIFRDDLEEITNVPMGVHPKVRKKIEGFAKERGWTVSIGEAGIRATFRKPKG